MDHDLSGLKTSLICNIDVHHHQRDDDLTFYLGSHPDDAGAAQGVIFGLSAEENHDVELSALGAGLRSSIRRRPTNNQSDEPGPWAADVLLLPSAYRRPAGATISLSTRETDPRSGRLRRSLRTTAAHSRRRDDVTDVRPCCGTSGGPGFAGFGAGERAAGGPVIRVFPGGRVAPRLETTRWASRLPHYRRQRGIVGVALTRGGPATLSEPPFVPRTSRSG